MPFLLLMPSYNQARFIHEAVESCLAQTDPDWELWILDNSSDDTPQVMARFSDPRIHFIHEPRRMDPGSCLNQLLAWAKGDHFSYIHTDNRLTPSFVGEMRKALGTHSHAVAYCDTLTVDEGGRPLGVDRRLVYDLGSVLGAHGLGVPFSATTRLAAELGGFSSGDLADDVLFASRAFGRGPWTRIPRPLVEYRVHGGSRTEAGGYDRVVMAILKAQAAALGDLEARGLRPLEAMAEELSRIREELRQAALDGWLRHGPGPLPSSADPLSLLWTEGLIRFAGFGARKGGPSRRPRWKGRVGALAWPGLRMKLSSLQAEVDRVWPSFRSVLLGWAYLQAPAVGSATRCWVGGTDPLTLWAARTLAAELGWRLCLPAEGRPCHDPAWERAACPSTLEDGSVWLDLGATPAEAPKGGIRLMVER